jgi:hypothetical protein
VAEGGLQPVRAARVGERIRAAEHAQIEDTQPIERARGDGGDEPDEDATGDEQRGVDACRWRGLPGRPSGVAPDRDGDRHRRHRRVQRQDHRQQRIGQRGDVGAGQRPRQRPPYLADRRGADDLRRGVERQAAQAEHRGAAVAGERETDWRAHQIQRHRPIPGDDAGQPAGHRAGGEGDEGDKRPGGRTVAAHRGQREQEGDRPLWAPPGQPGDGKADRHGQDGPGVGAQDERERSERRQHGETARQRHPRAAQQPPRARARAGGDAHGGSAAGTRTTMARRRKPVTQSSTSDWRRSAASRARISSRTSANGRGRPSRR